MREDDNNGCRENSEKLRLLDAKIARILHILEGPSEGTPGLVGRLTRLEELLYGKEDFEGMVFKVKALWRMHVWVLCTLSGLAGFALRELVRIVWKI